MILIYLFNIILVSVHSNAIGPKAKILDGEIEGIYSKSYNGKDYMAFLGIPYATPPLNNFRFKDPVPVLPWKGTKITNQTTTCSQVAHTTQPIGGFTVGSEDCLHINVYIPGIKINPESNLDVIVFIHGGAFVFGEGHFGSPKFLMDRNIILVNFNYRLGILGFLSTGDKNLPGNYGMKDQVLAIKWIRNNIKHFGGNPNSITLNGLSAGGSSVHYHTLSPLSRGLFAKALSTSGCALNPWALDERPLEKAIIVAEAVGCLRNDTKELVECLKKQPAEVLTNTIRALRSWLFNPFSPVAPVIDDASPNPFLPKHPYIILLDKEVYDVPWMVSYVTEEGLYPGAELWANKSTLEDLNENWNKYAPDILHYRDVVDEKLMDFVSAKIKNHYLPGKTVNEKYFPQLIQMFSDRLFITDIGIAQLLHARAIKSPVYGYGFNYILEKRSSLYQLLANIKDKIGCGHGDDTMLVYSFEGKQPLGKISEMDTKAKDLLLDIFTSYAKNGFPNNPKWYPVCRHQCGINDNMFINKDLKMKLKREYNMGDRSFWRRLPIKENDNII